MIVDLPDEAATEALARELAGGAKPGDAFLLSGDLGAGKTTLARAFVRALGWAGPVRSPSFSLLNVYATDPPVVHADLYRVPSAEGLGLEDYLETHVLLVEWPDRLGGLISEADAWTVRLEVAGEGRTATVTPPVAPASRRCPLPSES